VRVQGGWVVVGGVGEECTEWCGSLLEAWQRQENKPHGYMAGSWGPQASAQLMASDRRRWFSIDEVLSGADQEW